MSQPGPRYPLAKAVSCYTRSLWENSLHLPSEAHSAEVTGPLRFSPQRTRLLGQSAMGSPQWMKSLSSPLKPSQAGYCSLAHHTGHIHQPDFSFRQEHWTGLIFKQRSAHSSWFNSPEAVSTWSLHPSLTHSDLSDLCVFFQLSLHTLNYLQLLRQDWTGFILENYLLLLIAMISTIA